MLVKYDVRFKHDFGYDRKTKTKKQSMTLIQWVPYRIVEASQQYFVAVIRWMHVHVLG